MLMPHYPLHRSFPFYPFYDILTKLVVYHFPSLPKTPCPQGESLGTATKNPSWFPTLLHTPVALSIQLTLRKHPLMDSSCTWTLPWVLLPTWRDQKGLESSVGPVDFLQQPFSTKIHERLAELLLPVTIPLCRLFVQCVRSPCKA